MGSAKLRERVTGSCTDLVARLYARWITEEDNAESRRVMSEMPLPMRLVNRWVLLPHYRRSSRW